MADEFDAMVQKAITDLMAKCEPDKAFRLECLKLTAKTAADAKSAVEDAKLLWAFVRGV
jgi:hypothetical protein